MNVTCDSPLQAAKEELSILLCELWRGPFLGHRKVDSHDDTETDSRAGQGRSALLAAFTGRDDLRREYPRRRRRPFRHHVFFGSPGI